MRSPTLAPTLSAIILAGGRSGRMGTDKALLAMPDGQPLLARTTQIARQLTSDVVVVTSWPERYQLLLPPKVQLVQEKAACGPLNGFAQGWAHTRADWCLLLACDLPYLQSEPLQQWWAWILNQRPPGNLAASLVPKFSHKSPDQRPLNPRSLMKAKRWDPLCGFYHRQCLPSLHRHLSLQNSQGTTRRQQSFQAWLADLPILAYTRLPAAMLFNCNTPEEWAITQSNISPEIP